MSESQSPYITLGRHLKYVREQSQQSLAEVSGAVEIDEPTLARIEAGEVRPAEDILLLLISHFGVQDQEAVQLWELADYDADMPDHIKSDGAATGSKSVVMLLALDTRTLYSDGLDIMANQAGLTLTFTQATGPAQSNPIARVGVSYEQADLIVQTLQRTLLQAKYLKDTKLLPPPQLEA